jgi:pimeloyl-ACP methyl ester carboxylesterase
MNRTCDPLEIEQEQSRPGAAASALRGIMWGSVALVGAAALTNTLIFARAPKAGNRMGGTFERYPSRHGDVAYTVHGAGAPLLLLHGFGAGNSSLEWEANIAELARHHTVYALDFLGWGLSDRYRHLHTAQDYIEVIVNFLDDVVNEPCAIAASSQAGPLAVEAAAQQPSLVSALVLVCPSIGGDGGAGPERKALQKVLSLPVVGTSIYNFIASRRGIQKFSHDHLFFDKTRVDESLVARFHTTAHQTDAQYGVYSFLGGAFDVDVREAWSRLEIPTLLVWGRNARLDGLETAPEWLALKPDARLAVIDDAMLLPHAEHPQQWNRLVLDWLEQVAKPQEAVPAL